jgi:hypothetical protein
MYKIVKFDFEKLEEGMEVFDVVKGWGKVVVIRSRYDSFPIVLGNGKTFKRDGTFDTNDRMPRLVAMRVKKKADEIPTVEFEKGELNWVVKKGVVHWYADCAGEHEFFGAKYYTRENASLVCKLLNEEEK